MPFRQELITSRGNHWLKQLRQVASRGSTTATGCALAESPLLLQEAMRSDVRIERVFTSQTATPGVMRSLPPHASVPIHPVADTLFRDVTTTARSQGVLALVKLPDWQPERVFAGLTVALDGVQDPGNAGTIVRTAEAFGASGVVFLPGTCSPTNPKLLRAAAGSLVRVPFAPKVGREEFLELASRHGKRLLAAAAGDGIALPEAPLGDDAAIIIGSETHGVCPLLADNSTPVAIATRSVESLNASIAAAIVLYEFARRSPRP